MTNARFLFGYFGFSFFLLTGTLVSQFIGTASAQTSQPDNTATTEYDAQLVAAMADAADKFGDVARGAFVFADARYACISCHKVGAIGGTIGPDFNELVSKKRSPIQLVESILWPQRLVEPEYVSYSVIDLDGRTHTGYRDDHAKDEQSIVLRDPATGNLSTVNRADIDEEITTGSLMPDRLVAAMSYAEQLDLIRFVIALSRPDGVNIEDIQILLQQAQSHRVAQFEYDRRPLEPGKWSHWDQPVNRDRIYDFYAKQADHFRNDPHARLLSAFPGLDGGTQGHWGNQNEATWSDSRWNETKLSSVQAGVFRGAGVTVARGICVRLGDTGELSACFNPDTLTYDALWSGGFVRFSAVRHGFVSGLSLEGTPLDRPLGNKPDEPFIYQGFYRNGNRVLFSYRIGKIDYLDAPWVNDGQFERIVAPRNSHPLKHLIQGGAALWPETIETKIELGQGAPYAVDTIQLPTENPWKALLFCGGLDFLPDGSALVCTMQGDVWHVTDFTHGDQKPQSNVAHWRRFASGLHHALGLLIAEDGIYVQCRDQLIRLHDLNGDGEADFYECFSNAFETSPAGHDFICGLQRDVAGNFYTASGNQGVVRISADGKSATVVATGFRNPDGIGLTPDGFLTVPCSEGEWTPASMVCALQLAEEPASDRSDLLPHFGYRGPRGNQTPQLPLAYLPRGLDNSSGEQVFIDSDRWGPYADQLVHLSFGAGTHFLLLRDRVGEQWQGGIVPLEGDFLSGVHRGRFNPVDGQLYVCGMHGWGCYTPEDGCFQRVRYTGQSVQGPVGFHVHENGILVRFAEPLRDDSVLLPENHFAQCWNYRYSAAYGSPEFSTRHIATPGHDVLRIASVQRVEDDRALFFEIPQIQPVNQLHLRMRSASDQPHDLFVTVHALDEPFRDFPGYRDSPKTIAPHPLLADLTLATKRVPNPWLNEIKDARQVKIATAQNLTFATRSFSAKPGEAIGFTLVNPDVVPHNWALLTPGSLQRVGQQANLLIADPEALARQYVPQSDEVLCFTDIVEPQTEFTIYFHAPEKPGRYPYVCTFPGHWMVMHGELIVE
jgi:putative heme-binding domain-containing protein